jgi:aspartyl protease family protein
MLRLAAMILIFATVIGALMPSGRHAPVEQTSGDPPIHPPFAASSSAAPTADPASYSSGGGITLQRYDDGHFYADAQVNGMPVHFLVDTGASGIALAREDAERAGLPLDPAEGGVIGSGASGEVRGHYVRLDRVALGPKEVEGIQAVVLEGGALSLLGQSFLSQFASVEIHGDEMVLR